MEVKLIIPGVPVAKARPQFNRKTGRVYTPNKTRSYESLIKEMAYDSFTKPIDGPVAISLFFYFPRTKGQMWKRKPMDRISHCKYPDLDNVIKSTLDGLNTIAFRDDRQVFSIYAKKYVCSGTEGPRTEIRMVW